MADAPILRYLVKQTWFLLPLKNALAFSSRGRSLPQAMSSFFAQATHFCILILLVLAILDCTCRAASHFRFDEATGFIFAVREGLSTGDPHIYRVASVSMHIDFRSDL